MSRDVGLCGALAGKGRGCPPKGKKPDTRQRGRLVSQGGRIPRQTAARMAFHSSSFDQNLLPWRFMSFFTLRQMPRILFAT